MLKSNGLSIGVTGVADGSAGFCAGLFFVYQPRKVARAASAAGAGFVITGAVAVSPAFTACDEMLLVLPGQFVVVLNFTMQDGAEALRTTRVQALLAQLLVQERKQADFILKGKSVLKTVPHQQKWFTQNARF